MRTSMRTSMHKGPPRALHPQTGKKYKSHHKYESTLESKLESQFEKTLEKTFEHCGGRGRRWLLSHAAPGGENKFGDKVGDKCGDTVCAVDSGDSELRVRPRAESSDCRKRRVSTSVISQALGPHCRKPKYMHISLSDCASII